MGDRMNKVWCVCVGVRPCLKPFRREVKNVLGCRYIHSSRYTHSASVEKNGKSNSSYYHFATDILVFNSKYNSYFFSRWVCLKSFTVLSKFILAYFIPKFSHIPRSGHWYPPFICVWWLSIKIH